MMLTLPASRGPSPASELQAIEVILAQGDEEARTVKEIAAQTGMPVQTVHRRLRLRNLIPALRAAFDLGEISVSIAEAAARLTMEQQAGLDRLLVAGERLTLATIRDIARERTETAAVELPHWLKALTSRTCVEATGVYWHPVYYALEDDFERLLVNAQHVKNVSFFVPSREVLHTGYTPRAVEP